jgi:hypothetical protein
MLVTFKSTATESVRMFEDVAVPLLKMMGATGRVPGAFTADDVPAAVATLERSLSGIHSGVMADTPALPAENEDLSVEDEEEFEPPITLTTRAVPLLEMMRRAAAAKAEVMWEGK